MSITVAIIDLTVTNGADRFWRVARNLPDVEFLAVTTQRDPGDVSGGQMLEQWPNVRVVASQDLEELGCKIDVVLEPALWPDDCTEWIDLVLAQIAPHRHRSDLGGRR